MRERPELDVATLAARCPVLVDRPLATRLRRAAIAAGAILWSLAIVYLVRDRSPFEQALGAIPLAVGLALLAALARRVRRTGSFRLAADGHQLYFHEALGGGVRALDWHRCLRLRTEPTRGGHALHFEFERHVGERTWTSLLHARVFVRDTSVEIVAGGLPDAPALAERLDALRQGATDAAAGTGEDRRREAA